MLKRIQSQMICALCVLPMLVMAGVPAAPVDLLRADFDSKTIGQAIGTGGAALGEPFQIVDLDTDIADCATTATVDRCLDVKNDLSSTSARPVRWQLLNNAEVTTGVVSISFDFTPSALDKYVFAVRESGGSAKTFLTLSSLPDGAFTANDANGSITLNSFTYSSGQLLKMRFDFDLDVGVSQASINGTALFTGRVHGVVGRGVGRLNTGYSSGSAGSTFRLNNLVVQTPQALPIILDANFNNQPLAQPLAAGGASLNQPVSIGAGISTQVTMVAAGNNVLNMSLPSALQTARTIRWQFLDNIEVLPGAVAFETDVQFVNLNAYLFLVRETSSNASAYAGLIFAPNGQISVIDASGSEFISGASYQAGVRYRLRLTFDQARGVYSALLNDAVLFADRAHEVTTGRGIGALMMGFNSNATAGAAMLIDDVQVGASAAPDIVSEMAILQQPSTGTVGQALMPTFEVGAINVFDQALSGALVSVEIATGPPGAVLTQNIASTVAGAASFPNLAVSAPGVYQLRARADRAQVTSMMQLTVAAPPNMLFRNGFE